MHSPLLRAVLLFSFFASPLHAAEPPKMPKLSDPALKIELLCTVPEVEAPTTICGAPDGSFYVGCDPRDTRLNTTQPECFVVRFSSVGAEKKRTVFADKIFSPAGSAWWEGWLYVAHDPFLTRFKDTDGDGVADVREDLITNLGMQPGTGLNDHCASGFTLGMDGFFYLSIGDRGTFQTKSVKDGSTISLQGGGIIRFRPDGTQLEVFSSGTRNHLAVLLDAEDNAFTLDNTDDGNGWWTRLTHHIEGGYYGYPYDYQKAPNYGVTQPSQQTLDAMKRNGHGRNDQGPMTNDQASKSAAALSDIGHWSFSIGHFPFLPAMTDFGGGSPTGGVCYLSDGLPEAYRGKLIFSEWGKGGLFVIEVARDGATFKFVKNTPLLESEKGADFRPMQISVAHDGSLLIADWAWGGWKGPKTVGNIWRLSWPEAKAAPRLKDEFGRIRLSSGSSTFWDSPHVDELVAALGHPDRDQRLRAQAALVALGGAGVPPAVPGILPGAPVTRAPGVLGGTPAAAGGTPAPPDKLAALVLDPSAPQTQRMHALWALENIAGPLCLDWPRNSSKQNSQLLGIFNRTLETAGRDGTGPLRAQAMRALSHRRTWFDCESVASLAAELHRSEDAAVRLQAVLTIGRAGGYEPLPSLAIKSLDDPDPSVRSAARFSLGQVLSKYGLSGHDLDTKQFAGPELSPQVWLTFQRLAFGEPVKFTPKIQSANAEDHREIVEFIAKRLGRALGATKADRADAATTLGLIGFRPKPWDGHWWGTQPVKNPPSPKSVAWEGTAQALKALTTALSDADAGVRLAAAGAFAEFTLDESGKDAGAALRARLTAESDAAIRRQLIESLGVQKDPLAMEVFMQIALDEKADAEFRATAINAVVNIGGDDARKTIARLASAPLSSAATRKVIQAAGQLKVVEAAPALLAHLQDENAGNREFAIKSLGQLGAKANALEGLIGALADKDAKVQTAAVEALGGLRDKRALPALLEFGKTKRARRETINAVAATPDPQALPFLVEALREKGGGERRAALGALKKMRAEAWPMIEEQLTSGRIPAEFAPEIRMAFASGVIAKWKMIGPFENVWEAVHPPETEMLAAMARVSSDQKSVNGGSASPITDHRSPITVALALRYTNAEGKDAAWTEVTASADEGRVNLEKVFKSNGMVCAYAFTTIESPEDADARLFCGSDDQLAVWVNGKKIHDSGAGSRGFSADQDEVPLRLAKGRNAVLVKIGNLAGPWEFAARIPGVEDGKFTPAKEPAPDVKQRAFVLATKPDGAWLHPGDAQRGEKIFFDPNAGLGGICATCHAVRGKGGKIGPDLSAIAVNYRRPELAVSILEPNKTIALGFEQNIVETTGGETFVGALRQETNDALTLVGADAQPRVIKKSDVRTKKALESSLMPPGLTLALKPEDFADLLAYLETLK